MGKGVSMPRKSKVLQKIYRGLIGGTCASLVVLIFGPLWHSFLGHSHGFGFYSFNVLGWILLYCFGAIVGSTKGVIIGLVDLLEKSWLTLICSLILWGARSSIELFHTIKHTKKSTISRRWLCRTIHISGHFVRAYCCQRTRYLGFHSKREIKDKLNESSQQLCRGLRMREIKGV